MDKADQIADECQRAWLRIAKAGGAGPPFDPVAVKRVIWRTMAQIIRDALKGHSDLLAACETAEGELTRLDVERFGTVSGETKRIRAAIAAAHGE